MSKNLETILGKAEARIMPKKANMLINGEPVVAINDSFSTSSKYGDLLVLQSKNYALIMGMVHSFSERCENNIAANIRTKELDDVIRKKSSCSSYEFRVIPVDARDQFQNYVQRKLSKQPQFSGKDIFVYRGPIENKFKFSMVPCETAKTKRAY